MEETLKGHTVQLLARKKALPRLDLPKVRPCCRHCRTGTTPPRLLSQGVLTATVDQRLAQEKALPLRDLPRAGPVRLLPT